jgi:hypothetical protein
MVFRTAGAIATVLIGVTGQALAQYYPPPQPDPRQPLPPTVIADELPPLNAPWCRGICCRRSEWDQLISRRPAPGINREPPLIPQIPPRATRVCSRKITGRP